MKLRRIPFVRQVTESGPDDRVFDALLLAGPLVILIIAALGETLLVLQRALAALYIAAFVGYVLYKGLR